MFIVKDDEVNRSFIPGDTRRDLRNTIRAMTKSSTWGGWGAREKGLSPLPTFFDVKIGIMDIK